MAGEVIAAEEKVNQRGDSQRSAQMRLEGQQRGGERSQRDVFAAQGKRHQRRAKQNGEDELSNIKTSDNGHEEDGNDE